jgi:hypothetical protein
VDVPAHPYQVMGIAMQREWRVALTLSETVAIPEKTSPPRSPSP